MRKTVLTVVAGLLLLSTNMAFADGNILLSSCNLVVNVMDAPLQATTTVEESVKQGNCIGIITGVTGLNRLYEYVLRSLGKNGLFCLPNDKITGGQLVRIVVKYMKEHPEELHEDDVFLVVKALGKAYPCK